MSLSAASILTMANHLRTTISQSQSMTYSIRGTHEVSDVLAIWRLKPAKQVLKKTYFVTGPVHWAWLSLAGRMSVDAAEPSEEGTAPGLDQQPSSPHSHPTKTNQHHWQIWHQNKIFPVLLLLNHRLLVLLAFSFLVHPKLNTSSCPILCRLSITSVLSCTGNQSTVPHSKQIYAECKAFNCTHFVSFTCSKFENSMASQQKPGPSHRQPHFQLCFTTLHFTQVSKC